MKLVKATFYVSLFLLSGLQEAGAETAKELGDLFALPEIALCRSGQVPDACVLDPQEYYCAAERLLEYDQEMFDDLYSFMENPAGKVEPDSMQKYRIFRAECRNEDSPPEFSREEVLRIFCGGDHIGREIPQCTCFASEADPDVYLLKKYAMIVSSFLSHGKVVDSGMTSEDWERTMSWSSKCGL